MTPRRPYLSAAALAVLACLALASCRSPVQSALTTAVSVSIAIPESLASDVPEAVRRAMAADDPTLAAQARYVHPDTRYLTGTLSYEDASGAPVTMSTSGTRAAGQASVDLSFEAVPLGVRATVAVRLYDSDGAGQVLLGTSDLTIDAVGSGPAAMSMAPVASAPIVLGPYSVGVRGIRIAEYANGQTFVYSFTVTNAGAYLASLTGVGLTASPAIFTADGRRVTASRTSSGTGVLRFDAAAGDYFAVAEIPAAYDGQSTLVVDADVTMTLETPAIYVDSSLTVMDRKRPIVLSCTVGFAEGSYTGGAVSGDTAELTGTVPASGTTYTISTPRNSRAAAAPTLSFSYTDRLLGIARTGSLVIPAQRTVVYYASTPTKYPSWSPPSTNSLYGAANTVSLTAPYSTEAGIPVVALQDGDSVDGGEGASFSRNVIVVGGCDASWSRASTHGTSTITWGDGHVLGYELGVSAGGSSFHDLILTRPARTMTGDSEAMIILTSSASFTDCAIRSGDVTAPGTSIASYGIVTISGSGGATVSFNRCSIVGGTFMPDAAYPSCSLFGIRNTSSGGVTTIVANSFIDPGEYACSGDGAFVYGVFDSSSGDYLHIIGSTVSSGYFYPVTGVSLNSFAVYANQVQSNGMWMRAYNNLFIDAAASSGVTNYVTSYILSYQDGSYATILRNALTNVASPQNGYLLLEGTNKRTNLEAAAIDDSTNTYSPISALGLSSDYRPSAGSSLGAGGVDLRDADVRANFDSALPAGDDYYAFDLAGNPRSGSSIGAWELP